MKKLFQNITAFFARNSRKEVKEKFVEYGGTFDGDATGSETVYFVNTEDKARQGLVFSDEWISDCIESGYLLKLGHYVIVDGEQNSVLTTCNMLKKKFGYAGSYIKDLKEKASLLSLKDQLMLSKFDFDVNAVNKTASKHNAKNDEKKQKGKIKEIPKGLSEEFENFIPGQNGRIVKKKKINHH